MSIGHEEILLSASEPGSDGRLDSWKEIAAYLRRSVRSVRRWEKEEGLPVRRHVHRKGDSVYAYKAELDGWRNARRTTQSDPTGAAETAPSLDEPATTDLEPRSGDSKPAASSTPPARHWPRRAAWIGAGLALAILTAGVIARLSRDGPVRPAGPTRLLAFQARDWVLVTDFENHTMEPLFDGTLEYALTRELANSRHVNVVPRGRIGDALRLMRKPLDTRLDAVVGRDVCLRDGEIRALLTGRLERLGSKYQVSVEIVEPRTGTTLAGFSEEASAGTGSLSAVRRISDQIRRTLGETLPPGSAERPLPKVTTSSLRALQLYSQANLLMDGGGSQSAAEELLKRAVAEDPEFASAYILLAHAINNQDRPLEDYRPYAETAFRLADTTSERERLFVRGSYYQFLGNREKAIAAYEALLSLYPDHHWATGNLILVYDEWRDPDIFRIQELEVRLGDLRPSSFNANFDAAYTSIFWRNDRSRGQRYLSRARELIGPEVTRDSPIAAAWIELWPYAERWLDGDLKGAARELDRFAAKLDSTTGVARDYLAVPAALSYLTLGKIETARRIARTIADPLAAQTTLGQAAFIKNDPLALRGPLPFLGARKSDFRNERWSNMTPVLQARAGLLAEARRFLEAMERKRPSTGGHETIRGEIALAEGNLETAIKELEEAEATRLRTGRPPSLYFYLGSESLAAAWERKGDVRRAMEVLERASEQRLPAVTGLDPGVPYWMKDRLALARLYRRVGRAKDALAIESELRRLLVLADADHPILRELQESGKS
jgi:tetratricopeptide (TPR) repeat protein